MAEARVVLLLPMVLWLSIEWFIAEGVSKSPQSVCRTLTQGGSLFSWIRKQSPKRKLHASRTRLVRKVDRNYAPFQQQLLLHLPTPPAQQPSGMVSTLSLGGYGFDSWLVQTNWYILLLGLALSIQCWTWRVRSTSDSQVWHHCFPPQPQGMMGQMQRTLRITGT